MKFARVQSANSCFLTVNLSSLFASGAVLISGVYDLRPLVKTSINEPLKLTE